MKPALLKEFVGERLRNWKFNLLDLQAMPLYCIARHVNEPGVSLVLLLPKEDDLPFRDLIQIQENVLAMTRASACREDPSLSRDQSHYIHLSQSAEETWPGCPPDLLVAAGPLSHTLTLDGVLCRPWRAYTCNGERVTLFVHRVRCEDGSAFQLAADTYLLEQRPPEDLEKPDERC